MKIEKQVNTIEQGAKLATLGIDKGCLFFWSINSYNQDVKEVTQTPDSRDIVFPAFTVAELGKMLMAALVKDDYEPSKSVLKRHGGDANQDEYLEKMFTAVLLADLLIDSIENNVTTATEVNQRLNS